MARAVDGDNALPSAATCFFRLTYVAWVVCVGCATEGAVSLSFVYYSGARLPTWYSSAEVLKQRFKYAMVEGARMTEA